MHYCCFFTSEKPFNADFFRLLNWVCLQKHFELIKKLCIYDDIHVDAHNSFFEMRKKNQIINIKINSFMWRLLDFCEKCTGISNLDNFSVFQKLFSCLIVDLKVDMYPNLRTEHSENFNFSIFSWKTSNYSFETWNSIKFFQKRSKTP